MILEPTYLDALRYIVTRAVEYGCYAVIGCAICVFWVLT